MKALIDSNFSLLARWYQLTLVVAIIFIIVIHFELLNEWLASFFLISSIIILVPVLGDQVALPSGQQTFLRYNKVIWRYFAYVIVFPLSSFCNVTLIDLATSLFGGATWDLVDDKFILLYSLDKLIIFAFLHYISALGFGLCIRLINNRKRKAGAIMN